MFDRCDKDKNGVLTPNELVPVVMELSQESESSITLDHCQAFIDIFNPDMKVITREKAIEFMKFMFTYEALLSDPDMLHAALEGKPVPAPKAEAAASTAEGTVAASTAIENVS